jgi:hypothetical protein
LWKVLTRKLQGTPEQFLITIFEYMKREECQKKRLIRKRDDDHVSLPSRENNELHTGT